MPLPASWSGKKQRAHENAPHGVKPDLDNLIKFVDVWNGILWEDDALIYAISAEKIYSKTPRTLLVLRCAKKELS